MIPSFIEANPSVERFSGYIERNYGEIQFFTDRTLTHMHVRFQRARRMGVEEDLAIGFAILSAEVDAIQDMTDTLNRSLPLIVPFDGPAVERKLVAKVTTRVAKFLRRQYAPPLLFRLFGWINRNPVRRRSEADYVRELGALLSPSSILANPAIN